MTDLGKMYQDLLAQGVPPSEIPATIARIASQAAVYKQRLLQNGYPQSYVDSLSSQELFNIGGSGALPLQTGSADLQREAQARNDAETALSNRSGAALSLMAVLNQEARDKAAAQNDTFRLPEALANLAGTGGSATPMQTLIGEGKYIAPQYTEDPMLAELKKRLMEYANPVPPNATDARVYAAYDEDPARAEAFFGRPDPRGHANGSMMLRKPVTMFDITGRPVGTAAENGPEMMDMNQQGIRFRPLPGVSRELRPGQTNQIAATTMRNMGMPSGAYGMSNIPRQPIVVPATDMPRRPPETVPYDAMPEHAPLANMLGRPLRGSAAQLLYRKNPEAARALHGKPMSAALIQYIYGPATGDTPVPGYIPGRAGGGWIAGAIKHPGALHRQMGVPDGKTIPAGRLKKAAAAPGKLGQRARLAVTLKGLRGHAKGGYMNADWGSELTRAYSEANPAAHRAAAQRELTVWPNVGPAGSAQKRYQQDMNAAENDQKLLDMKGTFDRYAARKAAAEARRIAEGTPPPNTPYRDLGGGKWELASGGGGSGNSGASTPDGGGVSIAAATAMALGKALQGNPFAHPDMVAALLAGRAPSPASITQRFRNNVDPVVLDTLLNSVMPAFGYRGADVLAEARRFDPQGLYTTVSR